MTAAPRGSTHLTVPQKFNYERAPVDSSPASGASSDRIRGVMEKPIHTPSPASETASGTLSGRSATYSYSPGGGVATGAENSPASDSARVSTTASSVLSGTNVSGISPSLPALPLHVVQAEGAPSATSRTARHSLPAADIRKMADQVAGTLGPDLHQGIERPGSKAPQSPLKAIADAAAEAVVLHRLDSKRPLPTDAIQDAALVGRVTDQVAAVAAAAYNSSAPPYGQLTAGQVRPFVREATQHRLRQVSDAEAGVSPQMPLSGGPADGRPRGATTTATSQATYRVPGEAADENEAHAQGIPVGAAAGASAAPVGDAEEPHVQTLPDNEQGGSCSGGCVIA